MREWLKDMRIRNGLTMKEMGEKLHISESYYCAIENGDRQKKMDVTLATGLSVIFGIPIAHVIELDQSKGTI